MSLKITRREKKSYILTTSALSPCTDTRPAFPLRWAFLIWFFKHLLTPKSSSMRKPWGPRFLLWARKYPGLELHSYSDFMPEHLSGLGWGSDARHSGWRAATWRCSWCWSSLGLSLQPTQRHWSGVGVGWGSWLGWTWVDFGNSCIP